MIAVYVLMVALSGCSVGTSGSPIAASPFAPAPTAGASVGAHLDGAAVSTALDATAAAGPARFRSVFSLETESYSQTMSRTDGVIDLAASRGLAITEDFPGQALSSKREVGLDGDQVFRRSLDAGAEWEKRSGGARSFLDLDAPGTSAKAVIEAVVRDPDRWVVVASEPDDAPGSVRIRPDDVDATGVIAVIDASGRLVSIITASDPSGEGRVHELTFVEFGVPLEFETPS